MRLENVSKEHHVLTWRKNIKTLKAALVDLCISIGLVSTDILDTDKSPLLILIFKKGHRGDGT